MKIVKGYNAETIKKISKNCGSENVKKTVDFLRVTNYHSKDKFYCEIIDDVAFFAVTISRGHFRLLEIAVEKEYQSKGYGKVMLLRLKNMCLNKNIKKITFRTSKSENARKWFLKNGATIIGEKGNDYEMEMIL